MADQAERVILEAEDQVTPIVDKANAGLDSFEKKAESSHGKVIRISDQTRTSVQRLIASLEKQAETYGKCGVDRLITQRDQLLQRYNREPQAIDAITRSYEKMIAMEEKAAREALAVKAAKEAEEALRKQAESITSFGERVSQFMENPLQGAKGAISSVLTALGPFGIAVATGAAVLGTIAVSAFEAAKSLGEYGTRVKDAELRTGLAAKEVGQFGFAARAVGQDISIVERLMRGLSQAADDNSQEGEKVRATLRGMGIDLHTATGEMKPTSEILVEISEGLNKLPEGLQRDAAAMDLFKRVGVEAIPFMTELNENLRVAHEQGFGPTEEDIRRFSEYQREVTVLETKWDALVRKFKEGLVVTVTWVGKGVDWFLNNICTAGDDERQRREEEQAMQDAAEIRAAGGYRREDVDLRPSPGSGRHGAPGAGHHEEPRCHLEAHRGFAGPTARAGRRFRHSAGASLPRATRRPERSARATSRARSSSCRRCWRMPRRPPSGRICMPARKRRIGFAPDSSARTRAWRRPTPTPRRMSSGSRNNCSNRTSR